MIRATESKEEIYLVSLDTFMLMAVMGITIGILFVIVNPIAKPPEWVPPDPVNSMITGVEFDKIWNDTSIPPLPDGNTQNIGKGFYRSSDNVSLNYYHRAAGLSYLTIYYSYDVHNDSYSLNFRLKPAREDFIYYSTDAESEKALAGNKRIMDFIGQFEILNPLIGD